MASNFKSSFQRKLPTNLCKIPGTKVSINNSQLLISSGVPSLDSIIGGGIAVGTILLIEEDVYSNYSNILFKYFLAEGVVSGHKLLLTSMNVDADRLLKNLPSPSIASDKSSLNSKDPSGHNTAELKIAWQYKNTPTVQTCVEVSQFGHYYDLSKTMDYELVEKSQPQTFDARGYSEMKGRSLYDRLIRSIYLHVNKENFATVAAPKENPTVLRIALHSLLSPLWSDGESTENANIAFCQFLYKLRAVMRYSLATCLITAPVHLLEDSAFVKRVERLCDVVLKLESFAGSEKETNPIFKDYQGLFHIIKLPVLNSLTCHRPIATDFGFKLRRRKFVIETLHLPPELPETTNRRQEEDLATFSGASVGCGGHTSVGRSKLEF